MISKHRIKPKAKEEQLLVDVWWRKGTAVEVFDGFCRSEEGSTGTQERTQLLVSCCRDTLRDQRLGP